MPALIPIKELGLFLFKEEFMMEENRKKVQAKRIDIVSVKLVREKTMMYRNRRIRSPHDAYELMKEFLGDGDREHFVVLCMDTIYGNV